MNDLILGLDIGSSSVRTALFDETGEALPGTLAKIDCSLTGVNIDAESVLTNVIESIDATLQRSSGIKGKIAHIASCAFWHSLVGVGADGKPTTEVFTWADTRSRKCTAKIQSDLDEAAVHHRTGARFHSSFWSSKMVWLKADRPEGWAGTTRWLSLSDHIQSKLCGNDSTSLSMASATGLLDQGKCAWDTELLNYLEIDESKLPKISHPNLTLDGSYQRRWPRLANARWHPAVGDGAANNVGSGCVTKNRAALMVGTSGAMRVYQGEPPDEIPTGLWCYRVDEKRVIVGGALSDGGGLYAWLKKNLHVELSDTAIGEEIARRGADAHGLTLMPFFFGERSTGYHENARGHIFGLNASHDAIDILQAAMEAVAFRFAEILDQLEAIAPIDEIVVSGGALDASPVWTQIIADVLGRDLLVSNQPEASLHGAVLLALESIGKIKNLEVSTVLNPKQFHPKCHEIYKAARKRHVATYNRLLNNNS